MNWLKRIKRRCRLFQYRKRLGGYTNLPFSSSICYESTIIQGAENLSIGNNVSIGYNAIFYCTLSKIRIEDNVVIGPGLTIIAGDHNFTVVGKYICDVNDKLPENDQDVVIESDCWIGANVTILKGVRIGRGSVIAACSCVTKSIPPYAIVGGVPAKHIKNRFSPEQIKKHELRLYGRII